MIKTIKDKKVYPCYQCNIKNTCIMACHRLENYCLIESQKKEVLKWIK